MIRVAAVRSLVFQRNNFSFLKLFLTAQTLPQKETTALVYLVVEAVHFSNLLQY